MKSCSPINAIAVEQRHRRHLQLCRLLNQSFWLRRRLKKTERTRRM
jgi:hypothetical protein